MIFNISLAEFKDSLKKTLPAISSKTTIPILEHLNFILEGNILKIISTDQDITIMTTVEVDGIEDGSVLIPGKRLNDVISSFNNNLELKFEVNQENYEIKYKYSTGNYTMKGLNPQDYLELPELFQSNKPNFDGENIIKEIGADIDAAFFEKEQLQRLAIKTGNSVSTDEFRPAMTGVLIQFRNNIVKAVSTDSYRLSMATLKTEKNNFPEELDLIIPSKTIGLIKLFDSDVLVSFIKSNSKITHIRFDVDNTIYISRIIDEKFPPYESVIPTNNELVALVDKTELLSSIKSVSQCSNRLSKQIKIKFESNTMVISGKDDDSGTDAILTKPCEYSNPESFEMGFNYTFLEQSINNLDNLENNIIYFTFSDPQSSALLLPSLNDSDVLMLIMPVRIS